MKKELLKLILIDVLQYSIDHDVNSNFGVCQLLHDTTYNVDSIDSDRINTFFQTVCTYCENEQIYDKLSKYGDFYYKMKRHLRENL